MAHFQLLSRWNINNLLTYAAQRSKLDGNPFNQINKALTVLVSDNSWFIAVNKTYQYISIYITYEKIAFSIARVRQWKLE